MKIKIITNTFGRYKRQDIAVESWKHLRNMFNSEISVDIVDFQFEGETPNPYEGIETRHVLAQSSQDMILLPTKKLPVVTEILHKGMELDYDYLIFTNSDVIIMPNLIEEIVNRNPKAIACSRLDIQDIDSFDNILQQKITPVRYEIAGFDTFVFQKEWIEEYYWKLFSSKYFLGKHLWDVVWAGYVKVFGDNQPLGNKYPPFCFHIHHGTAAVTTECPEKDWNTAAMKVNKMDIIMNNIMFYNLKKNLIRRTPWGGFINPQPDEISFEQEYFNILNIHTENNVT